MVPLSRQALRQALLDRPQTLRAGRIANPFLGAEFLLAHLDHVIAPEAPLGLLSGPTGQALVMRDPAQPGRWVALGSYYASRFGELPADLLAGTEVALAARSILPAGVVHLQPLAADDADAWTQHFLAAGWWVKRHDAFGNWHHACAGECFADYLAARPAALRHTLQRKQRRLTGPSAAAGALRILTRPEEVAGGMDAFETVYARSWKPQESHPGFIRAWALACARQGWLRLGILDWQGEPIAAQFWFTLDGRANIFKLAYDDRHRALSAGTVLSAAMFRHALEVDGVHEIDFLAGDDAYKQDWMSARRQRVGLLLTDPRTLRGLSVGLSEKARSLAAVGRAAWRR